MSIQHQNKTSQKKFYLYNINTKSIVEFDININTKFWQTMEILAYYIWLILANFANVGPKMAEYVHQYNTNNIEAIDHVINTTPTQNQSMI